jgi:uncharacterized membrane protein YccC
MNALPFVGWSRSGLPQRLRWPWIFLALLCLLPFILINAWSHDDNWLQAAAVTISVLVVSRETCSGPLLVLVHGLAIIAGFFVLFVFMPSTPLFVVLCAALGIFLLALTGWDRGLRSFGTWTFIPVLYTAIALDGTWTGDRVVGACHMAPYLLLGVAPVFVVATIHRALTRPADCPLGRHLARWHHRDAPLGNGVAAGLPGLSAALAVGLCAWIYKRHPCPEGEWFIWSAASVINADVQTTVKKFHDRMFGACIGVPAGFALGVLLVPHHALWVSLANLLTLLTIVAFRTYRPAFTVRCASHALIIALLGGGMLWQWSRMTNVVAGGVIGLGVYFLVRQLAGALRASRGAECSGNGRQ